MFLWGIKSGKKTEFYGVPLFKKYPNSKIVIGDNCRFRSDKRSNMVGINRKCMLSTYSSQSKIVIGKNSGFSGTVIAASKEIVIGDSVLCGANTLITDFDWHPIEPKDRLIRSGKSQSKPIFIKNNVWLGLDVVVLKGVTIGENSIIGAHSVVVKDIPPNVIAAGNPCKVIKEL